LVPRVFELRGHLLNENYEIIEKRIRDAVIFTIGIAGTVNEIWFQPDVRPYILAFLASLIGVPFILLADAKRRSNRNGRENNGDPS